MCCLMKSLCRGFSGLNCDRSSLVSPATRTLLCNLVYVLSYLQLQKAPKYGVNHCVLYIYPACCYFLFKGCVWYVSYQCSQVFTDSPRSYIPFYTPLHRRQTFLTGSQRGRGTYPYSLEIIGTIACATYFVKQCWAKVKTHLLTAKFLVQCFLTNSFIMENKCVLTMKQRGKLQTLPLIKERLSSMWCFSL